MAEHATRKRTNDRGPHPSRASKSTATVVAPKNQSGILTAMVLFILLALGGFVLWTVGQDPYPQDTAAVGAEAPATGGSASPNAIEPIAVDPPEASIEPAGQG